MVLLFVLFADSARRMLAVVEQPLPILIDRFPYGPLLAGHLGLKVVIHAFKVDQVVFDSRADQKLGQVVGIHNTIAVIEGVNAYGDQPVTIACAGGVSRAGRCSP